MVSLSRDPLTRTLLLVFAGIASVALLILSITLLVWVASSGDRAQPAPAPGDPTAANDPKSPASPSAPANAAKAAAGGGKRFTLRLGQGFRFKDGVVVAKSEDRPDVVFKYMPPQAGGVALRYNPISQQLETKVDPTLTSPAPLLVSAHVSAFEQKPNIARTTSGDMADFSNQAPIGPKARYVLLQTPAGEHYLLTLDELEAVPGKYDDWRIGFAYEQIQLPVGLAGGKINSPLPGKLIFRDWSRSKMILRVDLTSGKEEAIADGYLPSAVGQRVLGYADSIGAYVIRDAAGKTQSTTRFNDKVFGPQLSPDGTRVVGTISLPGEPTPAGLVTVAGPETPAVGVFDLAGRRIACFAGYDDAAWTPDGKLIATGKFNEPGLFEIDPATTKVRPIDAEVSYPYQPSVSPDGKTIAFVTGQRVWLIGRDGKNLRQVFQDGRVQQRPAFSPDGSKVALIVCNLLANDSTGEVFVKDLKTEELTALRTSTGMSLVPDTTTQLNWIP